MINKKGFTLSEVMITIGLVGVLAAILIPATTKITPSTNKIMAKKANYSLQKALANMINDDTNYPGDVMFAATTVPQGFANTTATTNGAANKFCYFLADQMNLVGTTTCGGAAPYTFTTTDGIVWRVTATAFANSDTYNTMVIADVNPKAIGCTTDTAGTAYAAACSDVTASCKGNPDTFIFGIRYDGKVRLGAGAGTDLCLNAILSNPTDNVR